MNLIQASRVYEATSEELTSYGNDAMACSGCYRLYSADDLPSAEETCICAEEKDEG